MTLRPTITPDGTTATSIVALASILNCNRDTILVWRRDEGAPPTLALDDWQTWLSEHRKLFWLGSLERFRGIDPAAPAEKKAPAAPSSEAAELYGPGGLLSESDEDQYRRRERRAKARTAELEQAEAEGRLVERALIERTIQRLAAASADALSAGIYAELQPALDGCSADARRSVRLAHDRAIIALRHRLVHIGSTVLTELLPALRKEPR